MNQDQPLKSHNEYKNLSSFFWSHLKHYVYKLVDPETKEIFYIGKGTGSRVLQHLDVTLDPKTIKREDGMDPKLDKIRDILNRGLTPEHQIIYHGLETHEEAYRIEAILIQECPGLTNKQSGHNISEFGAATLKDLIRRYDAKPMPDITHKIIMFKIDKRVRAGEEDPYLAARTAWTCSKTRVQKAELVFAIQDDVCVGVYRPTNWLPVIKNHFTEIEIDQPTKLGFIGIDEKDREGQKYYYRKLPPELRWKRSQVLGFSYFGC